MASLRPRPFSLRHTALALAAVCLGWAALPAHATLREATFSIRHDGTPGFDPLPGAGFDTGPDNGVVRTHDQFSYQVSLSTSGADDDIRIQLQFPASGSATPPAIWHYLPRECQAGSAISVDGQTLTCLLGNSPQSSTRTMSFDATVPGSTRNGAVIPTPDIRISSTQSPALTPRTMPPSLTVSAAPFYDVVIQDTFQGQPRAYAYSAGSGNRNEDGFYHRMQIGLLATNPNGHGKKGVEQLDPATPITIDVDLGGYPISTIVDNWRPPHANIGTYADGCGSGTRDGRYGTPHPLAGDQVNMHLRVTDHGPHPSPDNDTTAVLNGGECKVISGPMLSNNPFASPDPAAPLPGSTAGVPRQVRLQLEGTDTTLARTPTTLVNSASIPAGEFWVASKVLVLWSNLADYPLDTAVAHTLQLGSFSARSISGQAMQNVRTNNDQFQYTLTHQATGEFAKFFSPDNSVPMPLATVRDPAVIGNAITNHMAPGQSVTALLVYINTGSVTHTNLMLCDIIDRTAFDIGANFAVTQLNNDPQATPGTIEYGAPADGNPYFSSTDSALFHDEIRARSPNGRSTYSTATCADSNTGIRWFNTPQEAQANGGLVYVRAKQSRLPGTRMFVTQIRGLRMRHTWAATTSVLQPTPQVRRQGDPIPPGSIIRNQSHFLSDHLRFTPDYRYRDHLMVVPTRTTSRVEKSIIQPVTNGAPVPAGTTLTYEISGRYSTVHPPVRDTVVITDILPAGLKYLPGSSTLGGNIVDPEIRPDTPASGQTTLIWRMPGMIPHLGPDTEAGAALPRIRFQARVAPSITDGTVLRNNVSIRGGAHDVEPDCTYVAATNNFGACEKSFHSDIRIETPAGYDVEKSVTQTSIEPGEPFSYTLRFTSRGQELSPPDIPDLIDILPFAGDGQQRPDQQFDGRSPASAFQDGAYSLTGVTPPADDPGARVYFTSRPPTQIHNDPQHDSNRMPGGATTWCLANAFGTPGCPASMAQATAVRIVPALSIMRANVPYEVTLAMRSHPLLARKGDIFANHVGARPASNTSNLRYVSSSSQVHVSIGGNRSSLAGLVFADADRNGQQDQSDWPIPGHCVTLRGQTVGGRSELYSMRTNAQGQYAFTAGLSDTVYPTEDCTDTPLVLFPGLLSGSYEVSTVPADRRTAAGTGITGNQGGTAGSASVTGIPIPRDGVQATGYDLSLHPERPRLTLVNTVRNDNGGTATAADFTLGAESPATATRLTGTVQQPAITRAEVPVGTYTLGSSALRGYVAGTWQCLVNNTAPARAGEQLSLTWGDEATCTIVHDDQPTRLTLVKQLGPTAHGRQTRPADFRLHATPEGRNAPLMSGQSGDAGITRAEVPAGTYVLREDNLQGYTPAAMWSCSQPLRTGTPDTITLEQGDDVTCSITNHADALFVDLTAITTSNGDGNQPNQRQHQDVELVIVPGTTVPGQALPSNASRTRPSTDNLIHGNDYEIRATPRRGYDTHLTCFSGSAPNVTALPNTEDNLVRVRLTASVSCQVTLKRIAPTIEVSKVADGTARPIAGTSNEYEVRYLLSVTHRGGADAHYDLLDLPAFDGDVEVLGQQVQRNGEALDIQPINGQWQLASQQPLQMDGTHEYRLTFHLRVPFGSNTANNSCGAQTGARGNGLFNEARMTVRNDVSEAEQNGTAINAATAAAYNGNTTHETQACIPTPVPVATSALAIEKGSSTQSAEVGELVTYRLRILNLRNTPALAPVVVDQLPAGFRIEPDSIRVDNARQTGFSQTGRRVQIALDRIEAGTPGTPGTAGNPGGVLITYRVRLGPGSQEGDGTNRAHVECPAGSASTLQRCSNESRWKIAVHGGIFSEEACVAGQIFVDCNGNSIKDHEELGIPGVRLYLQNGTWLVSDEQGKYSHCGLRPRTHVLKVDRRTLPRRARLVTSSAQNIGDAHSLFLDVRKGMLHRADFIEGSCSNAVIEQVKARQQQDLANRVQTETGQPALTLDSKQGPYAAPRQQGTDRAQRLPAAPRH